MTKSNSMGGLERAVIHSLPPVVLSMCGKNTPDTSLVLSRFLQKASQSEKRLKEVLQKFEAASAYYRLIADSNRIEDPLSPEVITAYWLGNSLLDNIPLEKTREMIVNEFVGPRLLTPKEAQKKSGTMPPGAVPHHSFHVLFIGSVTGRVDFSNLLYRDACLIRWGQVVKIEETRMIVRYQPLEENDGQFSLGQEREQNLVRNQAFIPDVDFGNWISFHWFNACQVLTEEERSNLEKYTLQNIEAVNALRR